MKHIKEYLLNLNKWKHNFMLFIAFVGILFFIWYRFIRKRLPKDVPLTLNLFKASIIFSLCIILCISIYFILFPSKKRTVYSNFTAAFYLPLDYLDLYFKESTFIKPYFSKLFLKFEDFIKNYVYFIVMIEYFIKIVILIIFIIDVYYFEKLENIYSTIYLLPLLLCCKYIIYTLKKVQKTSMDRINSKVQIRSKDIRGPIISMEELVDLQITSLILTKKKKPFNIFMTLDYIDNQIKELNLKPGQSLNILGIRTRQYQVLNLVFSIGVTLFHYENIKQKYQWLHIIILLTYLGSWCYLLRISFHTIPYEDVLSLQKYLVNTDPFSDSYIK